MFHSDSHTPSRADWFAARALLASQRLRPFVPGGLAAVGLVFSAVYAVRGPLAARDKTTKGAAVRQEDTQPLSRSLRTAQVTLTSRDSTLRALQFQAEAHSGVPTLSPELQRTRDSLRLVLAQLDGALARAAKAPLSASYRELANTKAMRTPGGVQSLVDTLDLLDRVRLTLDPVEAPQREFAQISERINAIGAALEALGQARRAMLVRQVSAIEAGGTIGGRNAAPSTNTSLARVMRDGSRLAVLRAESLLRDAKQKNMKARAQADSTAHARAARILGAPPATAAIAALLIVMVLAFTLAVAAEVRRSTIAHAREVEHLTGVPVLGTVPRLQLPAEGRARLRPAVGIDPFRMIYLALTASGTRERTVCVTGDDPESVAAVAGRLAVSAASDEHATLAVDLAAGAPSVSRYFGERHEAGFSDAIASVRLWREVARPVGASEGLGLDVVPGGSPRPDTWESVQTASNRAEFHLFASEYEFAVLGAPTAASLSIAQILCSRPPTIFVARVAMTTLNSLDAKITELRRQEIALHGILLLDQR